MFIGLRLVAVFQKLDSSGRRSVIIQPSLALLRDCCIFGQTETVLLLFTAKEEKEKRFAVECEGIEIAVRHVRDRKEVEESEVQAAETSLRIL